MRFTVNSGKRNRGWQSSTGQEECQGDPGRGPPRRLAAAARPVRERFRHTASVLRTAARATFAALLISLVGCAPYVSTYRAPLDGRARVVWDADGELVVDPAGLVLTRECAGAIRALTGRDTMPLRGGAIDLPLEPAPIVVVGTAAGTWQPVYYGDPITVGATGVVSGGVTPVYFWLPGVFWDDYAGLRAGAQLSWYRGDVSLGNGGDGGEDVSDVDEAAVVMAVIAAVSLPIVDLFLATASPISRTQAASATDAVAAWNDLARTPGSPCAMPGGAAPLSPAEFARPGSP